MATTTYSAIRATQVSTIEALTPPTHPSVKFVHSREDQALADWALANPEASFRRFSLRDTLAYEGPEVSNCDLEYVRTAVELLVTYPKDFGRYGTLNDADMRKLIEQDAFKIDTAIGHRSQTTPADWLCRLKASHDTSDEGAVFVLAMHYEVGFYRAFT